MSDVSKTKRTREGEKWQTIVNQIKVVLSRVAASEVAVNKVAAKAAVSRPVAKAIKETSKAAAVKANARVISNGNVGRL